MMTNLDEWKKRQCDYINNMDALDYKEYLEANEEYLCDSCIMYKYGKCTLTEEQSENDISCWEGIEEWCNREVEE